MTIPADALIREARALCGVPWIHQGRTRLGVDCIGLIVLAARNAGIDIFRHCGIPQPRTYSRKPSAELFALVERHCRRIDSPTPGCLLFFRFVSDRHPRHFGLFTDTGTVIHAEAKVRCRVIEHGYRAQWLRWTDSVWLLPGIDYP